MKSSDIYVSGAGIISAIGAGLETHLLAVKQCRTGLNTYEFFKGQKPDPCVAGKIPGELIKNSLDETAGNRADLLAMHAMKQALQGSGISGPVGADLITGTTLGNMHGGTLFYQGYKKGENPSVDLVKHVLPDAVGTVLTKKLQIKGLHQTVSSACASGITAIGTALNRILRGHSNCSIACGVDALSPFVVAGFNSLRLLSKRECRPFDSSRDGLNPGEGAAVVILEKSEYLRTRSQQPLAKITGYGTALEAFHYTKSNPDGKGIVAAINKALTMADITPAQIDHIHAHGTATVFNDISEYNGFLHVFGERLKDIPVCSTKSMTGHTFGAAGAIAVIFAMLSINNGIVPATLFSGNVDPAFEKIRILDKPAYTKIKRVLCTSLGFGGEVAAVVVEGV